MSQITQVEPGFRIPIPPEWAGQLGMQSQVTLERVGDGILIRPCPAECMAPMTWEEFFADRLQVGTGNREETDEITGDDLLY